MTSEGLADDRVEFLESEIITLERLLREKAQQLADAQKTINLLEDVIHKGYKIVGHIPFLCSQLDGSSDIENAAMQAQRVLLHRES